MWCQDHVEDSEVMANMLCLSSGAGSRWMRRPIRMHFVSDWHMWGRSCPYPSFVIWSFWWSYKLFSFDWSWAFPVRFRGCFAILTRSSRCLNQVDCRCCLFAHVSDLRIRGDRDRRSLLDITKSGWWKILISPWSFPSSCWFQLERQNTFWKHHETLIWE